MTGTMQGDAQGVAVARHDDMLAVVAREHGRALFGYAYLLTADRQAAEDLVQDALVKVFARTRTGFAPDVAHRYVRSAILTLHIDRGRRAARWRNVRHLFTGAQSTDDTAGSAGIVSVRGALARLSDQERACVVLRFYDDLTVPAIAHELALAPGTVKRYLSNAMTKLEGILGPLEPDSDDDAEHWDITPVKAPRAPSDPTRTGRL